MEKFTIPSAAKPYVDELKEIARTGAAAFPRLENLELVNLPVVIAEAGDASTSRDRARAFISILKRVVAGNLTGKEVKTAKLLFALDEYAGVPTRDRYDQVARLHNPRWKWENFRKEPLDRHLFSVYLELYREGDQAAVKGSPEASAEETREVTPKLLLAGGRYRIVSRELTYNFPHAEGSPREVIDRREIEAVADNVEAWRQTVYFFGKGTTDAPDFTLFGPGKLSVLGEHPLNRAYKSGRAYQLEVKFPEPLMLGQRTQFMIYSRHVVPLNNLVRDNYHDGWKMAPVVPTSHFSITVRFPDHRLPARVWHYEDLPEALAPGSPSEMNTLAVDEFGVATYSWTSMLVGYAYGIEWEW
jgi:hypothetical protein